MSDQHHEGVEWTPEPVWTLRKGQKKITCAYEDSNPRPSSPWPSLYSYQGSAHKAIINNIRVTFKTNTNSLQNLTEHFRMRGSRLPQSFPSDHHISVTRHCAYLPLHQAELHVQAPLGRELPSRTLCMQSLEQTWIHLFMSDRFTRNSTAIKIVTVEAFPVLMTREIIIILFSC